MADMKITLKATLGRGEFYWVCNVNADSEDEAVVVAENLFAAEMEKSKDWEFTDFNIE